MENFFSNNNPEQKPESTPLVNQYDDIKENYKQIFVEAAESIRVAIDKFKPENPCEGCSHKDCKIEKKDIFSPYPPTGCKLREWQMKSITDHPAL